MPLHTNDCLPISTEAPVVTVPSSLAYPGTVLMKRLVSQRKYEPMVDEVEIIDANPEYAYVGLPDGRETTLSVHHLAPLEMVHLCT